MELQVESYRAIADGNEISLTLSGVSLADIIANHSVEEAVDALLEYKDFGEVFDYMMKVKGEDEE